MNEAAAIKAVEKQIKAWRGLQYNYAANLLQNFLNKKGPADYQPTSGDITESKLHARAKIGAKIKDYLNEKRREGPSYQPHFVLIRRAGQHTVNFTHPGKGSTKSSNIRWWYKGSDKNMLNAFGGADLNLSGTATIKETEHLLGLFTSRKFSGMFTVSVGDLYAFESTSKAKTEFSAWYSESYEAALYLERNHGYKPFYHKVSFVLTFTDEPL